MLAFPHGSTPLTRTLPHWQGHAELVSASAIIIQKKTIFEKNESPKMKILFPIIALAISTTIAQAQLTDAPCQQLKKSALIQSASNKNSTTSITNLTSDTIHAAHYAIYIDTLNYATKSLRAHTTVKLFSKQNNVTNISLSLLKLTVDSIVSGNQLLSYSYNDTTLSITPTNILNQNDSIILSVYYHGAPKQDASGWGGFYFSGNYAFNLGVGFDSDPHNVGKMWFPCIDEFTDRATYEFHITTASTSKAFCNGELQSQTNNPNGTITWNWFLDKAIPTYLACMAVAPYYTLEQNINGIPVEFAVMPTDTAKTLLTFQHLPQVLTAFENAWGPYPFNKVGYSVVPFNSGAMEHASQITIGATFINGTLNYETLWAHELSHMWWGDKVTCETAGDMWLNEGWASYNEAFINQAIYGQTAYKDWIRTNHRKVLQSAHIIDGSYLSFINVPHAYTYGTTVYNKGADAVHTLRYYMQDSAFFNACQYHLNQRAYNSSNSYQLRDNLTASSGIDMTRFFDDWIFTEGFPHFSIDSVTYQPGGLDHYFVHVRQRSKGNNHLYKMPIEINLTDGVNDTTFTFVMDSATQTFHCPIFFNATWISLDRGEKISDAITDYEKNITTIGFVLMPETNVKLEVLALGSFNPTIRIEHNWVAPDNWKQSNPGIRISDYHYWKVDGLFDNQFLCKAAFTYNGSTNTNTGYLDNTLITTSEDSLVMLYREGAGSDWQIVSGYTMNYGGSHTDKIGTLTIDTLKRGEYTLAMRDYTVSINEHAKADKPILKVQPNPVGQSCHIEFDLKGKKQALLQIYDSTGNVVKEFSVYAHQTFINWDVYEIKNGSYIAKLCIDDKTNATAKFIIAK